MNEPNPSTPAEPPGGPLRIAIIGYGFAGLCLAMRLKQSGIHGFTILEKSDRIGGTWRDNTYPGAACDVLSFQYCFSFEQKTDWTRKWSGQEEILGYMERCAAKYHLDEHVRFQTEVTEARYDAARGLWRIRTASGGREGEEFEAQVLVSGVGQLHRPAWPALPGLDDFAGPRFHSARWDHDADLAGKRIGVIGNGASAIQFVPEVAKVAQHLTVFQRTPNWIVPRGDAPYSERAKGLLSRHRWLARAYRVLLWMRQEMMYLAMTGNERLAALWARVAQRHLEEQIPDPELRRALTPDYPIGAKRILIHDDYYPALMRDDVSLVTSPVERVEPDGVVTADGTRHPLDVLILATGFETNAFLAPMSIAGRDGRMLDKVWEDGAEAYLGMTVPGFPNFFMMYGPNTNLGHNSILFMIECQANYIVACARRLRDRRLRALEVRPEVMQGFNAELHRDLDRMTWAKVDHSWYKTDQGKITNNWSGTTVQYWWRTRRPDFSDFVEGLGTVPQGPAGREQGRAGGGRLPGS